MDASLVVGGATARSRSSFVEPDRQWLRIEADRGGLEFSDPVFTDRWSRSTLTVTSPDGERERSGIVAFRHPTIPADDVDATLQRESVDIAVRRHALRISPSYYNDSDEIDRFLRALPQR